MPVDTGGQELDYLEKLIKKLEKMLGTHINWKEQLKERRLSDEEIHLLAEKLEKITQHPRAIIIPSNDKEMADYILNAAKDNDEVQNQFIANVSPEGRTTIWTNDAGLEFFNTETRKYILQSGKDIGYIREVSEADFLLGLEKDKDNDVVILNKLSEDQYNALTKKVYEEENAFSFVATEHKNEKGELEYDVAVKRKDYLNATKLGSRGDIFTSLVAREIFPNKESDLANKYEKALKEKILNYNSDKPMYVSQMTTGGPFFKIEKDKVTLIDAHGKSKIFHKSVGKEEFATDVLKYLDKFRQPVEITKEIELQKIQPTGLKIEEFLKQHAETGRDSDFMLKGKDGSGITPRPINRNSKFIKQQTQYKYVSSLVKHIEREAITQSMGEYIDASKKYAAKYLVDRGASEEVAKEFASKYNKALTLELSKRDPGVIKRDYTTIQHETFIKAYGGFRKAFPEETKELIDVNEQSFTNNYPARFNTLLKDKIDLIAAKDKVLEPFKEVKRSYKEFEKEAINQIIKNKDVSLPQKEVIKTEEFKEMSKKWYDDTVGKLAETSDHKMVTVFAKDLAFRDSKGSYIDLPDDLDKAVCDFTSIETTNIILDRSGDSIEIVNEDPQYDKHIKINEIMKSQDDNNRKHDKIINIQNNTRIATALGKDNDLSIKESEEELDMKFGD